MAGQKKSLGQALDAVIDALGALDESARLIAVKAACEQFSISLETARTSGQIPPSSGAQPQTPPTLPPAARAGDIVDIRSLKEEKNPSTDMEMAAIVAYYLSELAPNDLRKEIVGTSDIKEYFKQADYPLPQIPKQTLPNSKQAGYFDSAGHGKYKLNPVGYNLVAHNLPSVSKGDRAEKRRSGGKKKIKKSTKKKAKKQKKTSSKKRK